MDSVTCSACSLDRQLLEISMKDLEQGGKMGTLAESLKLHRAESQSGFMGEGPEAQKLLLKTCL